MPRQSLSQLSSSDRMFEKVNNHTWQTLTEKNV